MSEQSPILISKPNRRWFQFSLRAFFLGMIALSVVIAWWAQTAQRQRAAVAVITAAGGKVKYEFEYRRQRGAILESPIPGPLLKLCGVDAFHYVVEVAFPKNKAPVRGSTNEIVDQLSAFPHLRSLILARNDLTDQHLSAIANLRQLEDLSLDDGKAITEDGLDQLRKLRQLWRLTLVNCRLGKSNGDTLAGLPVLTQFYLWGGELAPDALIRIGSEGRLTSLILHKVDGVDDQALESLKGLKNLQFLELYGLEEITDEGLQNLADLTTLRRLFLHAATEITDVGLQHLVGLNHLEILQLGRMSTTAAGEEALQRALPKCRIDTFRPTSNSVRQADNSSEASK